MHVKTDTECHFQLLVVRLIHDPILVLELFVFNPPGGHDGDGLLDTVERYDPHRDTWTIITVLNSPCCLGALVALKGCLYAIGGYDGASVLQSLQVSSNQAPLSL